MPWHQARRDPTGLGRTIIWFGAWHQILLDHGDAGVDGMFARVCDASSYPYPKSYRPWFGPNSNTFLAHIARRVPGLAIQLPSNAVGKDFLPDGVYSPPHPAGPGFNYRFVGFGILLAAREGLEVNLLGLSLGVDPVKPALKLPALGRLGIAGL